MAYVGKFPHRIKTASFNRGNIWILTLNNGRVHKISASQIAGLMPKPGEEISRYIDAGLPMVKLSINPAKKNPVSDSPGDFSYSSNKVLGRAWSDAKSASGKDFGDVYRVVLTWPDKEWMGMLFDNETAARKTLTRLGFK